jgi:outer membrane immunogenic protein
MIRILFGSAALAAMLAGSAQAADKLVAAPRTFAPAAANWTGIYVGGNVGGVWGNTDPGFLNNCSATEFVPTDALRFLIPSAPGTFFPPGPGFFNPSCFFTGTNNTPAVIPSLPASVSAANQGALSTLSVVQAVGTQPFHNSGWTGGGQIGFNYQYQWVVFGIEWDMERFNPKGSQNVSGTYPLLTAGAPCFIAPVFGISGYGGCQFSFSQSSSGNWLTTVRGKVGAAWGNWLLYGTVGVAWAKISFTSNFADTTCAAGPTPAGVATAGGCGLVSNFSTTQTKAGVIGGAGLSYMLTRNWIVSVEYLRLDINGVGGDTRAVSTGGVLAPGAYGANFHYDTEFHENIVRAKIDYKL